MRRPITEVLLKVFRCNEEFMEYLEIETEEELKKISPYKVLKTAIKVYFKSLSNIEEIYQRAERYEERIKNNEDITQQSIEIEAEVYQRFLGYLDYFFPRQKKCAYDKQTHFWELPEEKRREDLDKYFINEATKYTSPVYVFDGEKEGELRLLQMWYPINYYGLDHLLWRGLVVDDMETNPMKNDELRRGAKFWGRKEWVQMQVDKVEDEKMRKKLKEYTYQTYLYMQFAQSGEGGIITKDRGETTNVYANIKLD